MLESLWKKHHHAGITGSFHGDMARTYAAILADPDCDLKTKLLIQRSISIHRRIESFPYHKDRQWFTEAFSH